MKAILTVNGVNVKCVNVCVEGSDLDDCVLTYAEREDGTALTAEEIESVSDRDVIDLFLEEGNLDW